MRTAGGLPPSASRPGESRKVRIIRTRYWLPLCLVLALAVCAAYPNYGYYYPYQSSYYPYDYSYPYYYSPYYYYPQGYYYYPYGYRGGGHGGHWQGGGHVRAGGEAEEAEAAVSTAVVAAAAVVVDVTDPRLPSGDQRRAARDLRGEESRRRKGTRERGPQPQLRRYTVRAAA